VCPNGNIAVEELLDDGVQVNYIETAPGHEWPTRLETDHWPSLGHWSGSSGADRGGKHWKA
jgi:hypothetical protein